MRPLRLIAALLIAAFALTGCMKVEIDIRIDAEQDTISGSMVFAMDKAVLTMDGKSPEEAFKDAADDFDDLPKGSRVEVYDDGKFYGQRVVFEKMPFADFNKAEAGAPRIEHADGKYTFTMDADMSDADLGAEAEILKPLLDKIEMKISVTFPGKVIERDNLAKLDGNRVTWDLKMGSQHKLKAVAEEPAKLKWLLLAGVAGLFGLLAIIGIVLLALRLNASRRREAAAVPADPSATDPAATATDPAAATGPPADPTTMPPHLAASPDPSTQATPPAAVHPDTLAEAAPPAGTAGSATPPPPPPGPPSAP